MTLSLIYGRKYAQSKVGVVTFDTMVQEEHKFSSRVTYFPVERGTIVSDHIINQPDIVILSGLVSDTPLTIFAPFNRSNAAFNALIEIHNRRQIIDVVTGIKLYRNMAITSLDVPRTIKTGQTLTFNIELQRIIFDDNDQIFINENNVFAGTLDNTPRDIIKDNSNIPNLQDDPPLSLKDQASTASNLGFQSLNSVPPAVVPNISINLARIFGLGQILEKF
jgi:hypothetical protein